MSRAELIKRLCELREMYHWSQLGISATPAAVATLENGIYCVPCAADSQRCSCTSNLNQDQNNIDVVDSFTASASSSPITNSTPNSRSRVVVADLEDEGSSVPVGLHFPAEKVDELVLQRVPASARSRSKFIVLSDSEDEALVPTPAATKRRIFCDDEASEDNSPEKSFDGEDEVVDG